MKIVIDCNCGGKDFEISDYSSYAKCKKCGENMYIKDSEFNLDFEEIKNTDNENLRKEIEIFRKTTSQLMNRCYVLSKGTLCEFCGLKDNCNKC